MEESLDSFEQNAIQRFPRISVREDNSPGLMNTAILAEKITVHRSKAYDQLEPINLDSLI